MRTLKDPATSRAAQLATLRRAAGESPALAGVFLALADALESTTGVPFDVNESFRWTPVQANVVALAERVLAGAL